MTGMDADNFHVFVPLSVAVAAQVHFVVSVYQAHVKVLTDRVFESCKDGLSSFFIFFICFSCVFHFLYCSS